MQSNIKNKITNSFLSLFLVLLFLLSSFSILVYAKSEIIGDVNGDTKISSADALLTLQFSVNKITFSYEQDYVGDVNDSGTISSADALLILQYSVQKISKFPKEYSEMDLYYYKMDKNYGVDSSDFTVKTKADISAIRSMISDYGSVAEPSDVETYSLDDQGRLIDNSISKQLAKTDPTALTKYADAEFTSGTITLDGTVFNYAVPTDVTAYDAVPLYYEVYSTEGKTQQTHIEVNAFEEPDREDNNVDYFDLSLPGKVSLDVNYLGYQTATNNDDAPVWSKEAGDNISFGTAYPSYDTSDVIYSSTLPVKDKTWLLFDFTNTGNTILDSEGNGAFNWYPVLYKKNESTGEWSEYDTEVNRMERLFDYMYPGETSQMYLLFNNNSIPVGEYKVELNGQVKCEHDGYSWADKYIGGSTVFNASFEFNVTQDGAMTEPSEPQISSNIITRNNWLSSHEEFMTSYKTFSGVGTEDNPTTGIMYIQPATFTECFSIKLMHKSIAKCETAQVPVNIDTDSLSINLNTNNENWVVTENGTREPMLETQMMATMRGNSQISSSPDQVIINDLINMKEAGVNTLDSCIAFSYSTDGLDPEKFMMDCVRSMGCFDFIGYGMYPYSGSETIQNAARLFGSTYLEDDYNGNDIKGINKANGMLMDWSYIRYGDMYHYKADGTIPIMVEDSRGWLTLDHDWRLDMSGDTFKNRFTSWLEDAFGTVAKLNSAFGSSYSSFSGVDPRKDGLIENNWETMYNYTDKNDGNDVFVDWSNATRTLDIFRTLERIDDYKSALNYAGISGAKIWVQAESINYIAPGLNPNTTNADYRSYYYQASRGALIPEILADSGVIEGVRAYTGGAYPSEVYETVKQCTLNGINYCALVSPVAVKNLVINEKYGDSKAVSDFNLKNTKLKAAYVDNLYALYPILKATYEAGGVPGVMWMDYYCNLFITSTQYKELKFYSQKIQEMLNTDEGSEWANNFENTENNDENIKATWSYTKQYIDQMIATVDRNCVFTDSIYKK